MVDTSVLKELTLSLRRISADLRHCRAGDMALHGLVSLNGTSEALTITVRELQAAAEALAKNARLYAKGVSDLVAQLPNTSPGEGEAEQ
jgi:hypothetical protein